ncbi:MAG: ABC transporter substrate-binding protein [Lachnospiraceae bacterium]|nr:ABC transporter substrate-binding protein [Lachnospiraceae bacterium]
MKKRFLAVALTVAMGASLLAGCGSQAEETTAAAAEAATEAAKEEAKETEAAKEEAKEAAGAVYYLNFKPEQDQQWQDLAAAYTEETGVPVTVVTAASGEYETTLMSEMGKSSAPTLFQVNGPVGLANWTDYCYDLSGSEIYGQLTSEDFALKDGDAVKGIAYVVESYGIIANKTLLEQAGHSIDEITSFETLKAVAEDITARKDELGFAAFSSAGMDGSSDWRFKTHLANLPIYFEYQADGIGSTAEIKGTYLDNYRNIWDLYINNSTCEPAELAAKTGDDSRNEFLAGEAVFFQNGSWEYGNLVGEGKFTDDDLAMIPIYVGVGDEANQGLCTGTENYWCVNAEASEDDIQATLDFMNWCVTSDMGTDAMANQMGFVIPFQNAVESPNLFVKQDVEYTAAGKKPVSWNFPTMPSEEWKNGVGSALTAYAADQTDDNWAEVVTAFVEGWATEYAFANPQ